MKIAETCRCGARLEIDAVPSEVTFDAVRKSFAEWRTKHEGHEEPTSQQGSSESTLGSSADHTAPKSIHPMGFTPARPYGEHQN
jgi:hypothetical protein